MGSFLLEHRYITMFLIIVSIYYIFLWQKSKIILYAIMLHAKTMAKDMILCSEKEQEDWIIKKAMIFLPFSIRIFMNKNILISIIHELYYNSKIYTDND